MNPIHVPPKNFFTFDGLELQTQSELLLSLFPLLSSLLLTKKQALSTFHITPFLPPYTPPTLSLSASSLTYPQISLFLHSLLSLSLSLYLLSLSLSLSSLFS